MLFPKVGIWKPRRPKPKPMPEERRLHRFNGMVEILFINNEIRASITSYGESRLAEQKTPRDLLNFMITINDSHTVVCISGLLVAAEDFIAYKCLMQAFLKRAEELGLMEKTQ